VPQVSNTHSFAAFTAWVIMRPIVPYAATWSITFVAEPACAFSLSMLRSAGVGQLNDFNCQGSSDDGEPFREYRDSNAAFYHPTDRVDAINHTATGDDDQNQGRRSVVEAREAEWPHRERHHLPQSASQSR
jgi:hypothetical protein